NQAKLDILSYRTFIETGRLLLPAVIFVVLLAPYLLKLFGESYAAEGVRLLRLLCLSALPYLVTSTYLSIARVKRRITALIVVQSSLAVLIFGLSIVLMDRIGITGIGIAWLASQSVVATVLLFTGLIKVWLPYLNMQVPLRLLSAPRRALWRWRKRFYRRRASDLIPEIVDRISPIDSTAPPSDWKALRVLPTVSDMVVIPIGTEEHGVQALLKLPQTDSAVDSMRQQTAVLSRLHSDPRLQEWHRVLPSLLVVDESCGHPYIVERVMPGIEGRTMLTDPANRSRMQMAAALTIGELHRRTGVPVVVDRDRLMRWIDKPLSSLKTMVTAYLHNDGTEEAVDRLQTELHSALAGRSLTAGWVHGDFVPGNLLFTPDGASVTGIVDWDLASPEDIPQLDLTWFLIATRMAVEKRELGDVLRDLLERLEWRADEQQLLETARGRLTGDGLDSRSALLLCWLRHVTGMIYKSNRYATHRLWVAKNVVGVLSAI
ncbi:MAG: phosphotransferase, partial [Spirochaetaceae bacterium]